MKIRFDFVTNSSSSSFICFKITNEELSLACQRHGIPLKYYGNTMENFSWSYDDGYMDVETPNGGSITDWFISVLERMDFSYEKYCRKDELIEYLKANKDKIDDATTSSVIDHHSIVSDDDGSSYIGEVRKGGKITSYYLYDYEWDYEKMGNPLWEELQGDCNRIREEAKKIGNFNECEDPWANKDVGTGIFTSSINSVNQQTVCLSGDFDFGSKAKVEEFVAEKGGIITSSVTNKTNILLVGNKGSEAWTFGNYGRKIEKAISLKEKTGIVIIKETDFFKCNLDKEILDTQSKDVDNNDFVIKDLPDNTSTIVEYKGKSTDIVIPSKIGGKTITKIGDKIFKNFKDLTSVVIEDGINIIGEYAFNGCKKLAKVEVPNSVTKIGKSAFKDCKNLTTINIPNGITRIEEYTFTGCKNVTDVIIPNTVESIGIAAFKGCESIVSINIPSSIKVKGIERAAFEGCTSLESVIIENGIEIIDFDSYIYENCHNIKNIKFAQSVRLINGFSNCKNLTTIEIPNSVTEIGRLSFSGCKNLTSIEIPNSVTTIGELAFRGCESLTSVEIPDNVTEIREGAFSSCKNLISIDVDRNSNYYSMGNCLIEKRTNKLILGCKNSVIPLEVTTIGEDAFSGCKNLTSIEIPDSVTEIGDHAFSSCENLTRIEIPNSVTTIGKFAFAACESLTSIEIPNSVTEIGNHAFRECESLTSIEIPDSVTEIGDYAFLRCTNLTSIEIPNSVTEIGQSAFSKCTNLTNIEIPNSVTEIGMWAFEGCTSLTSVEIPNSVTEIGMWAFNHCDNIILKVKKNSCAHKYAQENNIEFELI